MKILSQLLDADLVKHCIKLDADGTEQPSKEDLVGLSLGRIWRDWACRKRIHSRGI